MMLTAIFNTRYYNLKVGYHRASNILSPGIVLRHHVLEHAVNTGFREFDFLGDVEEYKMHWACGVRKHGNILFVRRRGYWWACYRARYGAKRFLEYRLPWVLELKRVIQKRFESAKNRLTRQR